MSAPQVIGLTGGIGCGKTVATVALRSAGYVVIDADEVSRSITARGTDGERLLMQAFPAANADGALDRAALRKIIAENNDERIKLNMLVHATIIMEITKQLSSAPRPCIISAPLLFETELDNLCDATVCITCPKSLQISRVCGRDGITIADAEKIIAAQMPDDERRKRATYSVSSDCTITQFEKAVLELFDRICRGDTAK